MSNSVIVYEQNNIAVIGGGIQGAAGVGIPAGGAAGQVLSKIDGSDYNTQWSTPSGAVASVNSRTGTVVLTQDDIAAGTTNAVYTQAEKSKLAGLATVATSGAYNDLTGKPTLGTLAAQNGTFSGTSSGTNTGDQTITLTGDVTGSGGGSFSATIAANAVTNAKAAQMAAGTIKGNNGTSSANAADLTVAQVHGMLAVKPALQMLATRCGINPSAGGAQFNTAQPGCIARIQHYLPYGAKSLFPIYACFDVQVSGSGSERASPGGYGFYAATAAVVAGGASYAVGDVITVSGVATNQFAPTLHVDAVSSGAVTAVSVLSGGGFGSVPAAALATTRVTGSGNNALTVTLGVLPVTQVMQAGLEQAWGTQTAFSSTNLAGVMRFTLGTDVTGGKGNIALPFGSAVALDPLEVGLAAGSTIGTRLYTPGTGFYVGRYLSGSAGLNENSRSNIALSSAPPHGGTYPSHATPAPGFQPIAIMGIPQTPGPTFAIIGDSIAYGRVSSGGSTTQDSLDTDGNAGYLERALDRQAPWTNFSSSGATVTGWLAQTSAPIRYDLLSRLNVSHIVDQLGVNDLYGGAMTYANFKAAKIKFWQMLRGLGVKEIWACCITPVTTSTDAWVTTTNQTVTAASANIISYNTELRNGTFSSHIDRVLDATPAVETSANSGIWLANATSDGVHPAQTATVAMAALLTSTFGLATL